MPTWLQGLALVGCGVFAIASLVWAFWPVIEDIFWPEEPRLLPPKKGDRIKPVD